MYDRKSDAHPYHSVHKQIQDLYSAKEKALREIEDNYKKDIKELSKTTGEYETEFLAKVSAIIRKKDNTIVQFAQWNTLKIIFPDYWVNLSFHCDQTNSKSNEWDNRFGVSYTEYEPDGVEDLDRMIFESELRKHFGLECPVDDFNNYEEVAQDIMNKINELPKLMETIKERMNYLGKKKDCYFRDYKTIPKYYFNTIPASLISHDAGYRKEQWEKMLKYNNEWNEKAKG